MLDLFKQFEDSMEEENDMDKAFEELSNLKRNVQDSINARHEALHYAVDVLEEIINNDEITSIETNEKATKLLDEIDEISDELDKLLEELDT